MYPDFLGIGAQKAGTTWLHRNLQEHPQIWMPREKELHYFDEKLKLEGGLLTRLRSDRPVDRRWRRQCASRFRHLPNKESWKDLRWDLRYFFVPPNDKWYASLFEPGRGKITGETTPDYSILDTDTIKHVHHIMPQAKVIFFMRNPIERPWSAADMGLRISGRSLEEVPDRKVFRQFDRRRVRLMTNYMRTIENWGSFYPEEQIFVGFLEDIHLAPVRLLRNLYRFLGVDPSVNYRVMTRKIHSGQQDTMPTRFAVYLAHTYLEQLQVLHERFGGYASFWLYCAEKLVNDPPEEEQIPYPLWESQLWDEWEGSKDKIKVRSGPLSSLRAPS